MRGSFSSEAMTTNNKDYNRVIKRQNNLYERKNDLRTPFMRDYTRILFCQGYRRLKHKTQVFFSPDNDHICTRSEHVSLVESVSYTIGEYLGLNTDLIKAIAIGHDLGHTPFGHGGEKIISKIAKEHGLDNFWHEQNSLHFVDMIETLEDDNHVRHNLDLTYGVRDGLISHCGEMNQKQIIKRDEYIDLNDYKQPGQYNPFTWEGCVVKMADKIAYLARDIEDALTLNLLKQDQVNIVMEEINKYLDKPLLAINNGTVVNFFIQDVCQNSSLKNGIAMSDNAHQIMKILMKFNYQNIYLLDRLQIHANYVSLILKSIFDQLFNTYKLSQEEDFDFIKLLEKDQLKYPKLIPAYIHWLEKYAKITNRPRLDNYQNSFVYDYLDSKDICRSILDYISGMSDQYIIQIFNELISF